MWSTHEPPCWHGFESHPGSSAGINGFTTVFTVLHLVTLARWRPTIAGVLHMNAIGATNQCIFFLKGSSAVIGISFTQHLRETIHEHQWPLFSWIGQERILQFLHRWLVAPIVFICAMSWQLKATKYRILEACDYLVFHTFDRGILQLNVN